MKSHFDALRRLDEVLARRVDARTPYVVQKEELLELFAEIYLRRLLVRTKGNKTIAARLAGLDRSYFARMLRRYGLTSDSSRPSSVTSTSHVPERIDCARELERGG